MTSPSHGSSSRLRGQKGQVVVEYILLLTAVVFIAGFITRTMVSRNEDNPGFLISKWSRVIEVIANDIPE